MRRFVLGLLLLAVPPAAATDFYVDPVNGSDTSGTGTSGNPWRTLQSVIDTRVETRDWASLPYTPGGTLVTVNPGAPVKAGDTILLRTGYHGAILVQGAYNVAPVTVAAQAGHAPRLRTLTVRAAQNWVLRGLSISPSHAPPLGQTTIVDVDNHNFFGPAYDVELHDSDVFTVADATTWSATDWVDVASSGVDVGADRVTIRGCRVRNVRFGISVGGAFARIQENLIDGFSADGLRGLGNDGLFEYNRVQNNYVEDPPDPNHDDGFQSWSVGPGGVGTGEVRNVTLRGNVFVNHVDPSHPLRSSMQAIGCFDGWFVNWVVENNVVITDHWHGIAFLGMRDSRIVNNTVIDLQSGAPGPPWIAVIPHKNGQPSQNVVIRNNLATDYDLRGTNVVGDHNVEFTMANAANLFVAPPFDLHLRATATAAIDTGSPTLAPALDADRVPRPQGAGFDLGAYERFAPTVNVDDVAIVEGTGGTTNATFTVSLSAAHALAVTMAYQTANGTATSGSDYTAASGSLTFTPGQLTRTVSVPVIGDAVMEAEETFGLGLSGLVNATAGDVQGSATIVDDDAPSLTRLELGHGSAQWGDLRADPGPTADVDLFRLAQAPLASYEVVLDGTSGDIGPNALLERLASDNVTVLQSGVPAGTGSSVSLRWENTLSAPVAGQHIRVRSAGCTLACGADDVYRVRAYDTTYTIPRFNNSQGQVTLVILQNPTGQPVAGRLYFWSATGSLAYTHPFDLPARGVFQLNGATVGALQGRSGSITVSNDARYGALAGKAVSLESATGYSFDSPMVARPR